MASDFPSMQWPQLERVLKRKPLRYTIEGKGGSRKKCVSQAGYPELSLHFHDRAQLAPGLVRNILTKQVGLSEQEALKLL